MKHLPPMVLRRVTLRWSMAPVAFLMAHASHTPHGVTTRTAYYLYLLFAWPGAGGRSAPSWTERFGLDFWYTVRIRAVR